jgi:CubicO group peptidase (beta-lactamase class C family)
MRLIEEGLLGLDHTVTRWLPDFRPRLADGTAPDITVRQLLTHTSGLSYRLLEPHDSAYHALNISDGLDQPGPSMVENLARLAQAQVGAQAATAAPGWGFGYSWAVLDDPKAAETPQGKGTLRWGGAYGHSWFVDPTQRLTVVALTNTAFEGMIGRFVTDIRDAAYEALGERVR